MCVLPICTGIGKSKSFILGISNTHRQFIQC